MTNLKKLTTLAAALAPVLVWTTVPATLTTFGAAVVMTAVSKTAEAGCRTVRKVVHKHGKRVVVRYKTGIGCDTRSSAQIERDRRTLSGMSPSQRREALRKSRGSSKCPAGYRFEYFKSNHKAPSGAAEVFSKVRGALARMRPRAYCPECKQWGLRYGFKESYTSGYRVRGVCIKNSVPTSSVRWCLRGRTRYVWKFNR